MGNINGELLRVSYLQKEGEVETFDADGNPISIVIFYIFLNNLLIFQIFFYYKMPKTE